VDDILVYSRTFREHLKHLTLIFDRLRAAKLTLKPNKCQFALPEVIYLGHKITKFGLEVDPKKTEAVTSFPAPKSASEVRSFLGLCSWYRKFVKGFAEISAPLNKLLHKDQTFQWSEEAQQSFETLKRALVSPPTLTYPDMSKPFILTCDASGQSLGYILSQRDETNKEHPIAFGGRAVRQNEKHWPITELECLAVLEGIKQYRVYLTSQPFTIFTDHKALTWIKTFKPSHSNSRLFRWSLQLQEYEFEIIHRPGKQNQSDALSRRPYPVNTCLVDNPVEPENVDSECQKGRHETIAASFSYTKGPVKCELCKSPTITSEIHTVNVDSGNSDKENPENIASLQRDCPDFKQIIEYLETGQLPEQADQAKRIQNLSREYDMLNGTLVHFYQPRQKTPTADNRFITQIAMPKILRNDVLTSYHDSIAGGAHRGLQNTFAAIRLKYYWPRMYQQIHDYIKGCEVCQQAKVSRTDKPAPLHPLPVDEKWSRIHMDFIGPLPKSNGFSHILLITDSFSKWPEAFPLASQEATEVSKVLFREIFSRYGAPRTIVSDRGRNFMSKLVNALCEIFQVTHHCTSSYHPQTNAECERKNSTIEQSLRAYIDDKQSNWSQMLPGILMSMRMSPSTQSTTYSPYYLMFGKEMNLPFDTSIIPNNNLVKNAQQQINEVLENLKVAEKIAAENLEMAKEKSKDRHDAKAKEPDYQLGDLVWLRNPHTPVGLSPKLVQKYKGPYYITKVSGNSTYQLRQKSDDKLMQSHIHANRLKHHHDPTERIVVQPPIPASTPEPTTSDFIPDNQQQTPSSAQSEDASSDKPSTSQPGKSNNWREVEKLIKAAPWNGRKHYLVKWKHDSQQTWVPAEGVSEYLKREFHIKHTQSGKRRKRPYKYFQKKTTV
jgi:hypothetical protein